MKKMLSIFMALTLIFLTTACFAADKEKKSKVKFNEKLLSEIELEETPARDIPLIVMRQKPEDVTILGEPAATQGQMVNYINRRNPSPKLNCSVKELVQIYYEEAGLEGIRPDVAICQAIKETGVWNYGGDVLPEQNNYCGLGATGNHERGAYFESPRQGVRAHIQHLLAYTSKELPKTEITDPRYELIKKFRPQIFGKIKNWTGLNGVWAVPGKQYGHEILTLWQQAQIPDASEEAMESANYRVIVGEDKAAAFVYRGLVYAAREDFWTAQSEFRTALDFEPNLKEALFNLAVAQEKISRIDDAVKTYTQLLYLDKNFLPAYYNRGRLELAKEDYDAAIKDFRQTLTLEDRSVDALNEIAIAYFRQKKYSDAWKTLELAEETNSTNEIVKENKSRMESAKKK